jgi:16S rRNA processing protein RimM
LKDSIDNLVQIGYITKPHGLDGKVVVYLTTDVPNRLKINDKIYALEGENEPVELLIEKISPYKNKYLIVFSEINSLAGAEKLVGKPIFAAPIEHDPEDIWASDLFGCYVVDKLNALYGKVKVIIDNPASDIFELDSGILIPFKFVEQIKTLSLNDPDSGEDSIIVDTIKARYTISDQTNLKLGECDEVATIKVAFVDLPEGLAEIYTSNYSVKD